MADVKFTPGPWVLFNETDVFPDDGDTSGARHIADCDPAGAPLATPYDEAGQYTYEEALANAHLIAASPDLYEALKGILEITDREHVAWDKGHAALAKAEGQS